MKEIKVGEYVRTNNKGIKRIDRIDNNKTVNKYLYFTGIEDFEGKEYGIIKTTEIVKHSKQLIDLIEKDDYVNGSKVIAVMEDMETGELHLEMTSNYTNEEIGDCTIYDKDIKTILTKESYMANCYKVGGEDE